MITPWAKRKFSGIISICQKLLIPIPCVLASEDNILCLASVGLHRHILKSCKLTQLQDYQGRLSKFIPNETQAFNISTMLWKFVEMIDIDIDTDTAIDMDDIDIDI